VNPLRDPDAAAAAAFRAGQDLPPSQAAQLYAASEMKKAIDAAQRAADAKFIADAKAAAQHLTAAIPPPAPEPPAVSMFEKKAIDSTLSPAEKLGRNLDTALDIDAQIMALGVDREDAKTTRLVGEASGRTLATAVRVDEAQLRRDDYRMQNIDKLAGLLREKYDDAGGLKVTTTIEHEHDR